MGWKPPISAPASAAGCSAATGVAPLQCTTAWSARQDTERAMPAIRASGEVRNTRSQSRATASASSTRQSGSDAASARALASERLAARTTGTPAACRASDSARASRPAPMKPARRPPGSGSTHAAGCMPCTD